VRRTSRGEGLQGGALADVLFLVFPYEPLKCCAGVELVIKKHRSKGGGGVVTRFSAPQARICCLRQSWTPGQDLDGRSWTQHVASAKTYVARVRG